MMADQRMFDFCVVFSVILSALQLNVNMFAISHKMALKFSTQALRNYLKLPYQY